MLSKHLVLEEIGYKYDLNFLPDILISINSSVVLYSTDIYSLFRFITQLQQHYQPILPKCRLLLSFWLWPWPPPLWQPYRLLLRSAQQPLAPLLYGYRSKLKFASLIQIRTEKVSAVLRKGPVSGPRDSALALSL